MALGNDSVTVPSISIKSCLDNLLSPHLTSSEHLRGGKLRVCDTGEEHTTAVLTAVNILIITTALGLLCPVYFCDVLSTGQLPSQTFHPVRIVFCSFEPPILGVMLASPMLSVGTIQKALFQ